MSSNYLSLCKWACLRVEEQGRGAARKSKFVEQTNGPLQWHAEVNVDEHQRQRRLNDRRRPTGRSFDPMDVRSSPAPTRNHNKCILKKTSPKRLAIQSYAKGTTRFSQKLITIQRKNRYH